MHGVIHLTDIELQEIVFYKLKEMIIFYFISYCTKYISILNALNINLSENIIKINVFLYLGTLISSILSIIYFITCVVILLGRNFGMLKSIIKPVVAIEIEEPNRLADMLIEDFGMAVVPAKINDLETVFHYAAADNIMICCGPTDSSNTESLHAAQIDLPNLIN